MMLTALSSRLRGEGAFFNPTFYMCSDLAGATNTNQPNRLRSNDMKHNPLITLALMVAAPLLLASTAQAADGAAVYKDKTCVACHGKDAKTPLLPNYPRIAGQNKAYIIQQMKDIKSGARSNGQTAAMKGIMHLVSDEEIEAVADYVSKLPTND